MPSHTHRKADTGIASDQLPFVFDRFWRADKVGSRDAGGKGLGRATAHEIAQRHSAQLTVDSTVGQGSVFAIRFQTGV
jgi:signal transduction histidine kinase